MLTTLSIVNRDVPSRALRLAAGLALSLGLLAGAGLQAQQLEPQAIPGVQASAIAQINALMADKEARTAVERKMNSRLIYATRMARGQEAARGVRSLDIRLPAAADGRAVLDVRATVSDALLGQLEALGADILHSSTRHGSVRLQVDVRQAEAIAALPDVTFVMPKQEAITSRTPPTPPTMTREEWRRQGAQPRGLDRQALTARIRRQLAAQGVITNVGSKQSEGDKTHGADVARSTYTVDGTGVKVGVLSDGVTNLAASQALGDLGLDVTVLPGQTGSGDEGTAMLEIVHDLAPGAELYFATAFGSLTSFADNILALRAAGCDIIVDDVGYFVESPFQDGETGAVSSPTHGGLIAQAVKDVAADGALYFSSAANSGNLDQSYSGTWEGDFVNGGAATGPLAGAGSVHDFGGGQLYNVVTGTGLATTLFWSDPLGASGNDYDVFILNSTGTSIFDSSTDPQDGNDDPFEFAGPSYTGERIVVVLFSGAGRFIFLDTVRGRLTIATAGNTHGHNATSAANTFGVAATPAAASWAGPNPGPYPNKFNASNVVEKFSSDGPRRIFYQGDGTAITPGNVSSTGGQVLSKPDITAADGVMVTGVGGFPTTFYGTSAAAPHAAAIAALVKSRNLAQTATDISTAMLSTAIDIQGAGWDRNSGFGIVMADAALAAVGFGFTDSVLVPGVTPAKRVHVTELRTRVNSLRTGNGLSAFSFTDAALTVGASAIRAVHIAELRTALAAVYTQLALTPPTYTDPVLSSAISIKAIHITELRSAVVAVE